MRHIPFYLSQPCCVELTGKIVKNLVEKGAEITVSEDNLKAGGIDDSEIIKGVTISEKPYSDLVDLVMEKWRRVNGPRIITLQKALLLLGGPDVVWDPVKDEDNPPRFYEPLPSGPYKGQVTDKERVDIRTQAYYETLGWDERGIPTKKTLEKLDIADVEPLMAKLRK